MKQEYNPNSACSLILAPTRELAMQINDHIKKLAKFTKFHVYYFS
jgi:superfamily II DNA/RNA helicase